MARTDIIFAHTPLVRTHHVTGPHLTAKEAGKFSQAQYPEEEGIHSMTAGQSLSQGQSRNVGLGPRFHGADGSVRKTDPMQGSNSAIVHCR